MEELALLAGLDRGVVEPVLKTVVLSVVTRLTSEVCRSAGRQDRLLCGDGGNGAGAGGGPAAGAGVWWR